jgi:hypothetical protein
LQLKDIGMPALIKESEIAWADPVKIRFGFSGFSAEHALPIMRAIIQETWPTIRRPNQCVYVIRLIGDVAVDYPGGFSPVIYIGEGNVYSRLYQHANWLASLVASVPQVGIEVQIAEVARRNHDTLYQYIEADLIRWFAEERQSLPWFNRQRERGKEEHYEYEPEAERALRRRLGVGAGNAFLWAIKPTHNNDQHEPYAKGLAGV